MGIAKVCGIETEYGIQSGAFESNPGISSSLLINSYVADLKSRVGWDFEDESPGRDARGFNREGLYVAESEAHLVNFVLTNGARYYVDHAHPEYSSPECSTVLELLTHDRAGELIIERSMKCANRFASSGEEVVAYKNNSDGKGNSYGCHENYLVDREVPFARLAQEVTGHLVTRQIYTGSGKLGCEEEGSERGVFEISQRADFFEEEIGLETTLKRPIVNTRDEPHCDPRRYRRLHVIAGDANLAEVATFLKVGVTSLVLLLIEDDFLTDRSLVLEDPVPSMHAVSHDTTLRAKLRLAGGGAITALEYQFELLDLGRKYGESRGFDHLGGEAIGREILERWEFVLASLESDPGSLSRQLDWVAKIELFDAYCARHDCAMTDHRVSALDLQYHDMRPERSLFRRLKMDEIIDRTDVEWAVEHPPTTTRAYFRGECLRRFPESVVAANWDSIVFDVGDDPLRRVEMMEPLKGSAAYVDTLLARCSTPAELIDQLGG